MDFSFNLRLRATILIQCVTFLLFTAKRILNLLKFGIQIYAVINFSPITSIRWKWIKKMEFYFWTSVRLNEAFWMATNKNGIQKNESNWKKSKCKCLRFVCFFCYFSLTISLDLVNQLELRLAPVVTHSLRVEVPVDSSAEPRKYHLNAWQHYRLVV